MRNQRGAKVVVMMRGVIVRKVFQCVSKEDRQLEVRSEENLMSCEARKLALEGCKELMKLEQL
jgi:hypothetical protein